VHDLDQDMLMRTNQLLDSVAVRDARLLQLQDVYFPYMHARVITRKALGISTDISCARKHGTEAMLYILGGA
jgi:hypothetical protein